MCCRWTGSNQVGDVKAPDARKLRPARHCFSSGRQKQHGHGGCPAVVVAVSGPISQGRAEPSPHRALNWHIVTPVLGSQAPADQPHFRNLGRAAKSNVFRTRLHVH